MITGINFNIDAKLHLFIINNNRKHNLHNIFQKPHNQITIEVTTPPFPRDGCSASPTAHADDSALSISLIDFRIGFGMETHRFFSALAANWTSSTVKAGSGDGVLDVSEDSDDDISGGEG